MESKPLLSAGSLGSESDLVYVMKLNFELMVSVSRICDVFSCYSLRCQDQNNLAVCTYISIWENFLVPCMSDKAGFYSLEEGTLQYTSLGHALYQLPALASSTCFFVTIIAIVMLVIFILLFFLKFS